jgi:16S rRNA (guanine527-N7)-methyltransferase
LSEAVDHDLALASALSDAWQKDGFPLTQGQVSDLVGYLSLLNRWNRVHSLTAIQSGPQQVQRHLLDALVVWPELVRRFGSDPAIRIADIGSGMGVPGIVWSIVMPQSHFVLVERQQKKVAFLRHVIGRLGLSKRVSVASQDVRDVTAEHPFDLITSRAFAALPEFIRLTQHLSGPGTQWGAMVGKAPPEQEVSEHLLLKMNNKVGGLSLEEVVPLKVPGLSEPRHLVWIRRSS